LSLHFYILIDKTQKNPDEVKKERENNQEK
jgi:hypothetical protein